MKCVGTKIREASIKVDSHLLAVEVLWGKEILNLIKPLKKKISQLNIALKQKFSAKAKNKRSHGN